MFSLFHSHTLSFLLVSFKVLSSTHKKMRENATQALQTSDDGDDGDGGGFI